DRASRQGPLSPSFDPAGRAIPPPVQPWIATFENFERETFVGNACASASGSASRAGRQVDLAPRADFRGAGDRNDSYSRSAGGRGHYQYGARCRRTRGFDGKGRGRL